MLGGRVMIPMLRFPENENYETLGGLIVNSTEEIPQQNETIKIENILFGKHTRTIEGVT